MLHKVTFDSSSQGHVAMVIYEWEDAPYLGKVTNPDPYLPVGFLQWLYVILTHIFRRKPTCVHPMP
jgi:hypothetical protein